MKALSKARAIGGSIVVTIPSEIVKEQGIREGELLEVSVHKLKKSFFGAIQDVMPFSKKDELKSHD